MPPKRSSTTSAAKAKRTKTVVDAGKAALDVLRDPCEKDVTLTVAEADALLAYVQHLEEELEATKPPELTPDELAKEESQLRGLIVRGIERLLKWKPSCKTNSATFSFEGICADPRIMAALLDVEDATKFKAKKYTAAQFQDDIVWQSVTGSARYNKLYLNGNVNLRWNHENGQYKWTGKYGVSMFSATDKAMDKATDE